MTKEIATTLAGLKQRELVAIVSRWSTMPIDEHLAGVSKFSICARLGKLLNVVPLLSFLELERFARDCGVDATICSYNLCVSLERKSWKCQKIIGNFFIGTADEFDTCARRILVDYLMQPEQVLAVPSGSPR